MKFVSPRHPQLVVHDLGVTFVDGETEVTDKVTIDALRSLPATLACARPEVDLRRRPPTATSDKSGKDTTG